MKVPFCDLSDIPETIRAEWLSSWNQIAKSGTFIGGPFVDRFEEEWSESQLDGRPCLGVGNGFDAISVALRALKIGPGDVVAVPAHTFIATWLAVLSVSATPIGIDVDERGQIRSDLLTKLNPKPAAVVVVHMHGMSPPMRDISAWCHENKILLIEDCAQAHGSLLQGKQVGTWGDASAFSFYPTKNVGAVGDAGLVSFKDREASERARSLANYGTAPDSKYLHVALGVNTRLDPLQAAALSTNLKHLHAWNERRREVANAYLNCLADLPALHPLCNDLDANVWHHFVVSSSNRSAVRDALALQGIATDVHYPQVAALEIRQLLQESVGSLSESEFPQASRIANTCFSLPMHPFLTDQDVEMVCKALVTASESTSDTDNEGR